MSLITSSEDEHEFTLVGVDHDRATATTRMTVAGDIDRISAGRLRDTCAATLRTHLPRLLQLDVAGVAFLDSSGLRGLLACHDLAGRAGCRLVLVGTPEAVHLILKITDLLEHFGVSG